MLDRHDMRLLAGGAIAAAALVLSLVGVSRVASQSVSSRPPASLPVGLSIPGMAPIAGDTAPGVAPATAPSEQRRQVERMLDETSDLLR